MFNKEMDEYEERMSKRITKLSKKLAFEHGWKSVLTDTSITKRMRIEHGEYINILDVKDYFTAKIGFLLADCGDGKSYGLLEDKNAFGNTHPTLFLFPRTGLLNQAANDIKLDRKAIYCCSDENTGIKNKKIKYLETLSKNNHQIVTHLGTIYDNDRGSIDEYYTNNVLTTVDQLKNIEQKTIDKYEYIVLDECHLLSGDITYKEVVIDLFIKLVDKVVKSKNTRIILVSATPAHELTVLLHTYKEHIKILKYDR